MKRVVIVVWALLLVIVVCVYIFPRTILKSKAVHVHAGFQVYTNNKIVDFSDFKYMHEAPCTVNGKPVEGYKDEQMEKAHLHDQTGDVVHVHRDNAIWGDLFQNIKYPLSPENINVYINGVKTENFLEQKIEPYHSVVIFVGEQENVQVRLKNAVKKDRILQVEKKSETCSG